MVNYNPDFPEVLGNQLLATRDQKTRVHSRAPGRMLRIPSTTAEPIGSLMMSATVDPNLRASVPTLIDIMVEGNEFTDIPKLAKLLPNSDNVLGGWTKQDGTTTSMFAAINQDTSQWPGPADDGTWLQATSTGLEYACGVDASLFNGGAATNGRVFRVDVACILAATPGAYRQIAVKLLIDGVLYDPAGGSIREVHGYGEKYEFFWGELNPATKRPWLPSEVAQFDVQSDWGIRFYAYGGATASSYPKIMAASLNVRYLETENRLAVGVYRRPEDIGNQRLVNVTTDAIRALPGGATTWSKPATGNLLYFWRQTASQDQYGPTVADDLRWNGLYQDLGPAGQPPGVVYPLQSTGDSPPPAGAICSQEIVYDIWGRPQERFVGSSRAAYAIVPRTTAPANSVDSQPYRLDLADVVVFKQGSGITGQRFTPGTSQAYAGFRLPIIPPFADCSLTVSVHRVSDGVQMGGNFVITAANVGKIAHTDGGLRYLTGFFSSPASLVGGTQYEVRLTSTLTGAGVDNWIVFAPDCSLGNAAGFGGATSGAMIAGVHQTSRDMSVNLIREPNPPTGCTATIVNVVNTVPYVAAQIPTRQSVNVTWTVPASGMGSLFRRYELERSTDLGVTWKRIANLYQAAANSFGDREAARNTTNRYRIRVVGKDGRVSTYASSADVTPTAPSATGMFLILTSNHEPSLEVAYFYDKESSFLILSTEGKETHQIHGSDLQVVFREAENRGVGWQTNIWVNQASLTGKGGTHVLTPLLNLIESLDVPYVCVLDQQGSQIFGDVSASEVPQLQPAHRYTAQVTVTPTHTDPVPVEVL